MIGLLLYKISFSIIVLIGILLGYKLRRKVLYFAFIFISIFFLNGKPFVIGKFITILFFIFIFTYFLLSTRSYYIYKVSILALSFYITYLFASIIHYFLFGVENYRLFILESIPFFIFLLLYPEIIKKERMKISHPIFNLLVSISLIFPIISIIIFILFKNFSLAGSENITYFSFILTLCLSILYLLSKPFFHILSPIYFNIHSDLVNYLTQIISIDSMDALLQFSTNYISKKIKVEDLIIKKEDKYYKISFKEKKGKPLFFEEANFIDLIEKELNIRMNNIYFTLELQKKLDQIKELQDRIAQAEVYSLMGQMVGTVSHQLKTPLAILNNSNEILLQEKLTKKEKNEVLQTINEEISHLNEIVNKFLNFVKTKKYKLEEVDLNKIIENVIRKNHFDKEKIEITGSINEIIISNENALEEIFVIILQNGFDAISGISDGRIRIKIENMILSISDNGTKLDKNIEKIFEPFYTTKAKGIGLGLAIVSKLSDLLKIRLEVKQKKIWKYFTLYWGNS